MIEREKWAQLLGVDELDASSHASSHASSQQAHAASGAGGAGARGWDAHISSRGIVVANIATAILPEAFDETLGASAEMTARLMRVVYEEAPQDPLALLDAADAIEQYAEKAELPLPIYASATPSGRLVANVCAFASFDETSEAVECLHKITQKSLQALTQELTQGMLGTS